MPPLNPAPRAADRDHNDAARHPDTPTPEAADRNAATSRPTVVGVGADGWPGLTDAARAAIRSAATLLAAPRHLALIPADASEAVRESLPSPLRPNLAAAVRAAAPPTVVLASGDPTFFGIATTLAEVLGAPPHVLPHPSSASLACARLGWPADRTETVSLCGRPAHSLLAAALPGRRLLVLSADASTPATVAELLAGHGLGASRLTVLENLGDPLAERHLTGTADDWPHPPGAALNLVALECAGRTPLHSAPGLPDGVYDSDGQLTKREVRAVTLSSLRPRPGAVLWDVGGGSGSIAIEWLRTHPSCRAVTVEQHPERAVRIARNARELGVPRLQIVTGRAPEALADPGLPRPDAVFVGGGLTAPGLLDACWAALAPGGRLVANTVTLESEALLAARRRERGGELIRLEVSRADAVGGFTAWRPARPVTQWAATKPETEPVPAPEEEETA